MEIVINGTPHHVADGITVARAVSLIARAATGIAVAVNGEMVRRADWHATGLRPGDRIEVITAVQGG